MSDGFRNIPDFFAGKNVFITGGSGFLGKGLIEKLLRSCPSIGTIYVLMREKKGKNPEERLRELTQNALYDRLKQERPGALEKLQPVVGDVTELELGLSSKDRRTLQENVNIVYHAAASVRFDEPLKRAILLNARGTREVVTLTRGMRNLNLFVYVSTAYCNVDQAKTIEERLYESHADWKTAIEVAEQTDGYTLDILCPKYLGSMPNTYTYSKALAEHVVNDMCRGKVPALIFRPSIVISTLNEPVKGWLDNFNGLTGIVYGVGLGLIRSIYSKHDQKPDYIPLDICLKGLLVASWYEASSSARNDDVDSVVPVYNASGGDKFTMTTEETLRIGMQVILEYPMQTQIFYPTATVTTCKYSHYLKVVFLQVLPAIFLDLLLRVTGKKPKVFRIQRKIYTAMQALEYFAFNNWTFVNDKFMNLNEVLLKEDHKDFWFKETDFNAYEYCYQSMLGGQKYLIKEKVDNVEANKKYGRRLRIVHFSLLYSFYTLLFFIFVYNFDKITNVVSTTYVGLRA